MARLTVTPRGISTRPRGVKPPVVYAPLPSGGDDTAMLQALHDSNPAGTTIVLQRDSTYSFTQLAFAKAQNWMGGGHSLVASAAFGDSSYSTVPYSATGTVLRSTYTGAGAAITVGGSGSVYGGSFRDFVVIGPGSGTSTGIQLGGSATSGHVYVSNVIVANFNRNWLLNNALCNTFLGCESRGCNTGLDLQGLSNANTFVNFQSWYSATIGVFIESGDKNQFTGGSLENTSGTAGISTGATALNNVFSDWYIETANGSSTFPAVTITGTRNSVIRPRVTTATTFNITGGSWHRIEGPYFLAGLTINITSGGGHHFLIGCRDAGATITDALGNNLYEDAATGLAVKAPLTLGYAAATYGTTVTIDTAAAKWYRIAVNNTTPFTISLTNPPDTAHTREVVVEVSNGIGGAMTQLITWSGGVVFPIGAWVNPASGLFRFAKFEFNGANNRWICTAMATADY